MKYPALRNRIETIKKQAEVAETGGDITEVAEALEGLLVDLDEEGIEL